MVVVVVEFLNNTFMSVGIVPVCMSVYHFVPSARGGHIKSCETEVQFRAATSVLRIKPGSSERTVNVLSHCILSSAPLFVVWMCKPGKP